MVSSDLGLWILEILTDQVPTTTTATSAADAVATASAKPDWSFDQRSHPLAYVTARTS